jgi:ribosome maturation factor RimP
MNDVLEKIKAMAQKAASLIGVELIRVEYKRAGRGFVVRIVIHRDGGTGIRDCEQVSRLVEKDLDAADLIPGRYFLEVMSKGIP